MYLYNCFYKKVLMCVVLFFGKIKELSKKLGRMYHTQEVAGSSPAATIWLDYYQ